MAERDAVATANRAHWEREVEKQQGFTVPWLDLNKPIIEQYLSGELNPIPDSLFLMYPISVFRNVSDKDVLCLAAGGGQQTTIFGLLGARTTSVDITEGQLVGDRTAAQHYGYDIKTIRADMRDLSAIADNSFDLVFQGPSMSWVPDVREVYSEVARILRPSGIYRVDFNNPANHFMEWDGKNYCITQPYHERLFHPEGGLYDFRHYMGDIFNGLIAAGFSIREVEERPYLQPKPDAAPGSWNHQAAYYHVGFAIVAQIDAGS
jgi:SAM-dependent methyltransferase